MDMLIKTNDKAVHDIQSGNLKESLSTLEKMEKILEFAAINKKILDRNLVIVCLYNIACNHQAMWVLDKCSKYIDGVIYNLDQSLKQDEIHIKESLANQLDVNQRSALRAIKLRKLQFLLKVYLQHCAVLSQLSKHSEALVFAKKSQKTMTAIIAECADCCREAQRKVEGPLNLSMRPSTGHQEDEYTSDQSKIGSLLDSKRILENNSIFRDEVSYLKNILDYAVPFINDVIETIGTFTGHRDESILNKTRKSLFNWKNNPENNEKYLRKEFGKSKLLEELKDENRSLLGVQRPVEWLENLNIGTIMHMKPLKYKDYAQKKEFTNEITKDSLQEKIIFQSLIYFTIATEMRFMEMSNDKQGEKISQEEIRMREGYKNSEVYHLKAIELVCRYVNKPCPYINHLISSYQKHYNQDLETIPEESYYSTSEGGTTQEVSREYEGRNIPLLEQTNELNLNRNNQSKPDSTSNKNKVDKSHASKENLQSSAERNFKRVTEQLKEDKAKHPIQIKQENIERVFLKREIEELKKKREVSEEDEARIRKSFNMKSKRKLTDEDDLKAGLITNLSTGSMRIGNLLNHSLSPSHPLSSHPIHSKENIFRQEKEEDLSDPKYFVKRNYDIPSLNLGKVPNEAIKTQIIADRNSIEQESGFMSERNIKKVDTNKRVEFNSNSPRKAMAENDNSINLFFYKNFNKFIQNLYVQDEQGNKKPRLEGKKESKLANNPYSKEIAANMKKSSQNKRATTAQTTKSRPSTTNAQSGSKNCSLSFGKTYHREPDDSKKPIDTSGQARMEKDRDILRVNIDDKDLKNKLSNKFAKSISFKAVPNLDFSKVKNDKGKVKHISPRE